MQWHRESEVNIVTSGLDVAKQADWQFGRFSEQESQQTTIEALQPSQYSLA
jgi:hypothetical protein